MNPASLTRRSLLHLAGGAVSVVGLGACSPAGSGGLAGSPRESTEPGFTTAPDSAAPATTSTTFVESVANVDSRRLVVVQLMGGNDLLNTVPPLDGRYHDLRPTIAIADDERVPLAGVSEAGLHPSLAGLVPAWSDGSLAIIRGIGFAEPNRSHFVSMDRWWRADDLAAAGWLGRAVDLLENPLPPLYGTVLGGGSPLLVGDHSRPTAVSSPEAFQLNSLDPRWLDFGDGRGVLDGVARASIASALSAMDDFASLADETGGDTSDRPEATGATPITDGLTTAAQLLAGDVGARIVVVSAGGFDTHANQLAVHEGLLADLSGGLMLFHQRMADDGLGDDVMVVVTSEFGRRAAENGSGGTDHGSGGLSLMMGGGVRGGMYGAADLAALADGDVAAAVDPCALYTVCLDWLGADVERVLGRRDDTLLAGP